MGNFLSTRQRAYLNHAWSLMDVGGLALGDRLSNLNSNGGLGVGTTYHVNNISGDDDNDGLSWATAMAEVQTAITASEVVRKARGDSDAGDRYVRNLILVQATGTAYGPITSMPNHTDIIGVGAETIGNGAGIVIIDGGADDVAAMTGTLTAGEMRGCYWSNIQFRASGTTYVVNFVKCYRTTFEDCTFTSRNVGAKTPTGGIYFAGSTGAVVLRRCLVACDTAHHTIGINIQGSHFNNCLIEDCSIEGTTAGVFVKSASIIDVNTIWRRNIVGDLGGGCAKGVDDNNTVTDCGSLWAGNYITAVDAMEMTTRGTIRTIGNFVNDNGDGLIETA